MLYIITHPCPNFNGGLTKEHLLLGYGWVWLPLFVYGCNCLCNPKSPCWFSILCYLKRYRNFEAIIWQQGKHDDIIKWKYFPRYWPFVRGIHRSPVNSPHKGQWRGAMMFSLIRTLNKRLSKHSSDWWFGTPSCPLWRHRNDLRDLIAATGLIILRRLDSFILHQVLCTNS